MALERWEEIQRKRGNTAGAEMARVLREQYGDLPLVSGQIKEAKAKEIKRLTDEQKEALKRLGLSEVIPFSGRSIKVWREEGKPFWSTWHQEPQFAEFESMSSMLSEVAINPNQLFLPGSNRKTLKEQEEMVEKFSRDLAKKVPGVKAIIGEAPDYVELAFQHLDKTGEYLFGKKYNYDYTRTKTKTVESAVADVGSFDSDGGLHVRHWYRGNRLDVLWASPLVVPA